MSVWIRKERNKRWIGFILTGLLALLVSATIARQVIAFADYPFDSDEANHASSGLALFLELRAGDWPGFVREFYGQGFYPPGVSWLLALAYSLFGPSTLTARLFSTASFFLAMLMMWLFCQELDEKHGWWSGVIAATLTLSAQEILINSALAMLGMPGLLVSLAFLWGYVRAVKRPSPRRLLLASGLLALTFLTKYTFGVVMLATVSLMELSLLGSWRQTKPAESLRSFLWRQARQRWVWLGAPFVLVMLIWLGHPDKLAGFFSFIRPLPSSEPWLSTNNILFYLRSFAFHHVPSPLFTVITGLGLLWAFINWRILEARLILIYFISGLVLIMLVNHPGNPRFIVTIAPAAHILTAMMLSRFVSAWSSDDWRRKLITVAILMIFVMVSALSVPIAAERMAAYPSVMEVVYETNPRLTDIAAWIKTQLPTQEKFYIVNYWDQFGPRAVAWHWALQTPLPLHYADLLMPATVLEPATLENTAALVQTIDVSGAPYLVLLEGGSWGAPFWPEYTAVLADKLHLVAQEKFAIEQYGGRNWLNNSLLRQEEWETVKAQSRYTLNVQVSVFEIDFGPSE